MPTSPVYLLFSLQSARVVDMSISLKVWHHFTKILRVTLMAYLPLPCGGFPNLLNSVSYKSVFNSMKSYIPILFVK